MRKSQSHGALGRPKTPVWKETAGPLHERNILLRTPYDAVSDPNCSWTQRAAFQKQLKSMERAKRDQASEREGTAGSSASLPARAPLESGALPTGVPNLELSALKAIEAREFHLSRLHHLLSLDPAAAEAQVLVALRAEVCDELAALRISGVEVVEAVVRWRRRRRRRLEPFVWRSHNYLLKMCVDVFFLGLTPTVTDASADPFLLKACEPAAERPAAAANGGAERRPATAGGAAASPPPQSLSASVAQQHASPSPKQLDKPAVGPSPLGRRTSPAIKGAHGKTPAKRVQLPALGAYGSAASPSRPTPAAPRPTHGPSKAPAGSTGQEPPSAPAAATPAPAPISRKQQLAAFFSSRRRHTPHDLVRCPLARSQTTIARQSELCGGKSATHGSTEAARSIEAPRTRVAAALPAARA
jgi:hypothetical protein